MIRSAEISDSFKIFGLVDQLGYKQTVEAFSENFEKCLRYEGYHCLIFEDKNINLCGMVVFIIYPIFIKNPITAS